MGVGWTDRTGVSDASAVGVMNRRMTSSSHVYGIEFGRRGSVVVAGWDDGGRWESYRYSRGRNGGGKRRRGRGGGGDRERERERERVGYRRRLRVRVRVRVRRRRELLRLLRILSDDFLLFCFGFALHPAEGLAMFGKSVFRFRFRWEDGGGDSVEWVLTLNLAFVHGWSLRVSKGGSE